MMESVVYGSRRSFRSSFVIEEQYADNIPTPFSQYSLEHLIPPLTPPTILTLCKLHEWRQNDKLAE